MHAGHKILAVFAHPPGSKFHEAERNAARLCSLLTGINFVIGTYWQRGRFSEAVAFVSLTDNAARQFASRHLSPLRIPSLAGTGDMHLQWEEISWPQAKRWMMPAGPEPESDDEGE